MQNKIIDKINITGEIRLEQGLTKLGHVYLSCVLCVNGVDMYFCYEHYKFFKNIACNNIEL